MTDREVREIFENFKLIRPRDDRHGVCFDKRDPLGPSLATAYPASNGGTFSIRVWPGTREWDDARALLAEYGVVEE